MPLDWPLEPFVWPLTPGAIVRRIYKINWCDGLVMKRREWKIKEERKKGRNSFTEEKCTLVIGKEWLDFQIKKKKKKKRQDEGKILVAI